MWDGLTSAECQSSLTKVGLFAALNLRAVAVAWSSSQ